jgi:hypothetical protein
MSFCMNLVSLDHAYRFSRGDATRVVGVGIIALTSLSRWLPPAQIPSLMSIRGDEIKYSQWEARTWDFCTWTVIQTLQSGRNWSGERNAVNKSPPATSPFLDGGSINGAYCSSPLLSKGSMYHCARDDEDFF